MILSLTDLEAGQKRLEAGEQAYEFKTSDTSYRIFGPACEFGADYLRRCRSNGMYAVSLEEAQTLAHARSATITGIWFIKRTSEEQR